VRGVAFFAAGVLHKTSNVSAKPACALLYFVLFFPMTRSGTPGRHCWWSQGAGGRYSDPEAGDAEAAPVDAEVEV